MKIVRDDDNGMEERGLWWFDIVHKKTAPGHWYASVYAHDELEAWAIYKGYKKPYTRYVDTKVEHATDLAVIEEPTNNRLWKKWKKHFEEQAK